MQQVMEMVSKRKVNVLEINDLQKNRVYLGKFRFNSKTVIWQPCRLLSTTVEKNHNGFDCVRVYFMHLDKECTVYVNEYEGKQLLMDGGRSASLKEIDQKWVKREWEKAHAKLNEAERHVDFLDSLALEVDTRDE